MLPLVEIRVNVYAFDCLDYLEGCTGKGARLPWESTRWLGDKGGSRRCSLHPFLSFKLYYVSALTIQKWRNKLSVLACPSPHTLQAGCSTSRLPGDGQTGMGDAPLQEPPSYPPVQVIRVRVSSSSSSEVPSINSDLEVHAVACQ